MKRLNCKKLGRLLSLGACIYGLYIVNAALIHRYPFENDARDVIGNAHGTLMGGASVGAGGVWMFGTAGDYVELPPGLISKYQKITIEFWAEFFDNGNWSRVFDFGNRNANNLGTTYIFFSPHTGANDHRMSIAAADPGYNYEFVVTGPGVLDNLGIVHVACVYDPPYMGLYVNGKLVNQRFDIPISLNQIEDVYCWLGRSLYEPDAWLNGVIYEFRIYDDALKPAQIAASFVSGPDNPSIDPGPLQFISLKITPAVISIGGYFDYEVTADYQKVKGVSIPPNELTITSSDTNVVVVEGTMLRAVGRGIATITVAYNGMQASQIVEVIEMQPQLKHRWSFNEPAGATTVKDSVGGADGTLMGDAYIIGDGQVYLGGQNGFVDLPNGIISSKTNITIEVWTTWNDDGAWWQRIFDFGSSTAGEGMQGNGVSYIFLTPRGGWPGELRFVMKGTNTTERITDSPFGEPPSGKEFYVAVVYNYNARQAKLYLNGKLIATGPADVPLSALDDVNVWLGASQYGADRFYYGSYNEFRIWEGALTDTQIAIHAAAGPDTLPPADIGEPTKLQIIAPPSIEAGQEIQLQILADYQAVKGVDVSVLPTVLLRSENPSVLLALAGGKVQGTGIGTTKIIANFQGIEAEATITVNPATRVPYPPVLAHRYTFDGTGTTVKDVVGGADGTIYGNSELDGSGVLKLDPNDGTADYVDLPNRIISTKTNVTIEAWVIWRGPTGSSWQRIFDFGSSTGGEGNQGTGVTYFCLTPRAGNNRLRAIITNNGPGAAEEYIDGPARLVVNELVHVAVVYNSLDGQMRLYVNGERVGDTEVTYGLWELDDVNVWLGRSQFNDPYFNGEYYEFRIWNGILTDDLIKASYLAGPDALPGEGPREVTLSVSTTPEGIVISWPKSATGWTLETTTVLGPNAQWTPVTQQPVVVGEALQVTIQPTQKAQFFRLRR